MQLQPTRTKFYNIIANIIANIYNIIANIYNIIANCILSIQKSICFNKSYSSLENSQDIRSLNF